MIVRRSPVGPGQRGQLLGERRDDHGIVRPEKRGQARGRVPHEVEAARHALAAVDQQRERRRDALVADEIDRLRDVILLDDEIGDLRPLTNWPFLS